jgi:hypothetical protein
LSPCKNPVAGFCLILIIVYWFCQGLASQFGTERFLKAALSF